MENESKCPVVHGTVGVGTQNEDWWPNALNLRVLEQNPPAANPMGPDFDYASQF
jgi:catalase-peroxidase